MIKNDYKDFALVSTIPENWSIMPLKWFLVNHDGGAWGDEPTGEDGDRICIRIADFNYSKGTVKENTELTIRNYSQSVIDRLLLRKGDIIVEKSGGGDKTPVGRTIVFRQNYEALFANFSERLRIRSEYNYEFVNYCLRAFYYIGGSYNYFNQTTGIQNLSIGKYLSDIYLPCPDTSFQDAIVSYLDAKCAAIDEAIERHKKIIDKLEEYKKTATIKAVTKGIRGNAIDDSGEEWLGSIPKHWSVKRNWALFRETNERGNDALPILTVSINSGISDRELSDNESERVFVRSEDRSKYKRVQPGDIAYNMMRAWQGAFGAARVEGMVSPAYITARPIVKMDTRYFEYLMRTNIAAKEFEKYSRGITDFRLRLYYPEFRNIRVCVPPIEEQSEIADYLDVLYSKTEQAIKQNNAIVEKLEEYRKSIIYNAVTGKIDCRTVR